MSIRTGAIPLNGSIISIFTLTTRVSISIFNLTNECHNFCCAGLLCFGLFCIGFAMIVFAMSAILPIISQFEAEI